MSDKGDQPKNDESDKVILEGPGVNTWQTVSEEVVRARYFGMASAINNELQAVADQVDRPDLGSAFRLWSADNLQFDGQLDAALEAYQAVSELGPEVRLFGQSLAAVGGVNSAIACEQLGRYEEAASWYERLPSLGDEIHSPAWIRFHIGAVAEKAGLMNDAAAGYLAGADSPDEPATNSFAIPDLAARAGARLSNGPRDVPSEESALATALARAVRWGDGGALRELASPTHFKIGTNAGHLAFADHKAVLDRLTADLLNLKPGCDPQAVFGCGSKRYLPTVGWRGEYFSGRVDFLLTRHLGAWEWSGVVFHTPTKQWLTEWELEEKAHNQGTVRVPIKAPWPAGQDFRAGGLVNFIAESGAIAVSAAVPFFGWASALGMLAAFAARDCGYGPGGLFYNHWPTHLPPMNAFDVDFVRYQRFVPFHNTSGQADALAVRGGIVTADLVNNRGNGDPDIDNHVEIAHSFVSGALGVVIAELYRSRYLHLAGTPRILVSPMMFVRQGTRLGRIDDTGNSAYDHLHFTLQDELMGLASVRPNPIDGVSLLDHENGKCIRSSNVPFP